MTSYREVANKIVKKIKKIIRSHKLIIKSLNATHATCTCGRWNYRSTGIRSQEQIKETFSRHLKVV